MSRWSKKPPAGYEYIEPVMTALENELREKMNEPHEFKRNCEALWPIHQITWQRSRYVYDMYAKYKRISKKVYDYCVKAKLVDASLIAKWKKPGYEKLCSTHAINSKNFNFGTVSICRVPRHELSQDTSVRSTHSGCIGCASGRDGQDNIFGNKYGQYLAAIQVKREKLEAENSAKSVWENPTEVDSEKVQANKRDRENSSNEDEEVKRSKTN